jgi:sodium-coupled monocarboxylate transporter 8/12
MTRVILLSVPGVMILTTTACFCGIVIYANYADCDPLEAGLIEKRDELTTHFVLDRLGHLTGLPGLFVAALFSGALRYDLQYHGS